MFFIVARVLAACFFFFRLENFFMLGEFVSGKGKLSLFCQMRYLIMKSSVSAFACCSSADLERDAELSTPYIFQLLRVASKSESDPTCSLVWEVVIVKCFWMHKIFLLLDYLIQDFRYFSPSQLLAHFVIRVPQSLRIFIHTMLMLSLMIFETPIITFRSRCLRSPGSSPLLSLGPHQYPLWVVHILPSNILPISETTLLVILFLKTFHLTITSTSWRWCGRSLHGLPQPQARCSKPNKKSDKLCTARYFTACMSSFRPLTRPAGKGKRG